MYKLRESLIMPNGNTLVHFEYNEGRNSSFNTVEIVGNATNKTSEEILALAKQEVLDSIQPDNAIKRLKEELLEAKNQINIATEDAKNDMNNKIKEITEDTKKEMEKQLANSKIEMQMALAEAIGQLVGGK